MSDRLSIEKLIELITRQKTPFTLERVPITPDMGEVMKREQK